MSDPIRSRILGGLQNVPATAKQLTERLDGTPGDPCRRNCDFGKP